MLGVLSVVIGLLVLLWMFYDFIWPAPPSVERQLGKPDQPIEYTLKHSVSLKQFNHSNENCSIKGQMNQKMLILKPGSNFSGNCR